MKYSTKLLEYFHHRTHAGKLNHHCAGVYFSQTGHAENQEIFALYLDYQGCIVNAKFQAAGSVPLIAAGEFVCRWLQGKTWLDLTNLDCEFILEQLNLSSIYTPTVQLILLAIKNIIALMS